jgi:uncharacterized damage-inducible protein DinB
MKEAIRILLLRELDSFSREIELFPDDELLWRTVPGVTNSAGNLAMHVAGNLQHFVGAALGGTGYVRNRDLEFSRTSGTRAEVRAELDRARSVVARTLTRLSEESLGRNYPQPVLDRQLETGLFLLHLASHLAFHLGQAGYLRRILTGDTATTGAVATAALPAAGAIPAE